MGMKGSVILLAVVFSQGTPAWARGQKGKSLSDSSQEEPSNDTCGFFCESKGPNLIGLATCLTEAFGGINTTVRGIENFPKLVFPDDEEAYEVARANAGGTRFPAAVVYAGKSNTEVPDHDSNVKDVQKALSCARTNGYKVSARGHAHQYQSYGSMDGYVVIDLLNTCDEDTVVVNRDEQGPHLVPGSRYIATAKFGAGCNNAFVVSMLDTTFEPEEGAIGLAGSCPSVGVVGFLLGGGQGDATPYVGQATDVVHEVELVDWEGTKHTVSESENSDLFWALRGGGGGLGVITSITYKIVESPLPDSGDPKDRRVTWFYVNAKPGSSAAEVADFTHKFQDFVVNGPVEITAKFGGGQGRFQYLGSEKQAKMELEQYSKLSSFEIDTIGEYSEYADSMAAWYCIDTLASTDFSKIFSWINPSLHGEDMLIDICQDLGVDSAKYCVEQEAQIPGVGSFKWGRGLNPKMCRNDVTLLEAIKARGRDSQSFINHHGPSKELSERFGLVDFFLYGYGGNDLPGLLIPELELKTWEKIFKAKPGFAWGNHLNHGAPQLVGKKDTAYPWRGTTWGLTGEFNGSAEAKAAIAAMLTDKAFNNDPKNLMAYYNYMGPADVPGWEQSYFGDNYSRLQKIKTKYDPTGLFNKPMTVPGAIDTHSKPKSKNKKSKKKKSKKQKGSKKSTGGSQY